MTAEPAPIKNDPRCPICTAAATPRRRLSIASIAEALAPVARDEDRHARMRSEVTRLWPGGSVDVCVCGACSFGFAWPLVAGDEAFYQVLHERTGYPQARWEFQETIRTLPSTPGRLLDIGAGAGDFLRGLPPNIERHAVEASQMLRDGLAANDIHAHASITLAPGDFDHVTMFHVLQYFADPAAALRDAALKLSPGGRLYVSIPNALAAGRLDDLRSPPHPLTRWSQFALRAAADRAGLVVEREAFIPQKWSSLLWSAHARSRECNGPLFRAIDARKPSRTRTALLSTLALTRLPGVLLTARTRLAKAQIYFVLRHSAA